MNSNIIVQEIKRLYAENKNFIYKITILTSILFSGVYLFFAFKTNEDNDVSLLNNPETNQPAIFRVYLEQEDGTIYINSMIIEEYFKLPEVIDMAEKATGVKIKSELEDEVESNYQKSQYDRGVLGISRNGSTHIFTFIANVGTEEENLRVAQFYYDYLLSGKIKMLDNKLLYVVSGPEIYDEDSFAASDIITKKTNEVGIGSSSRREIIVTLLAIVLFSFFLGIFFSIISSILSKKIKYAFNLRVADNDRVLMLNKNNVNSFMRLLASKENNSNLILSEKELPATLLSSIKENNKAVANTLTAKDLNFISPSLEISQLFIFVHSSFTDKNWYKKIYNEVSLLNSSVTVIYFIEKKN